MSLGSYSHWEERYKAMSLEELHEKAKYLHERLVRSEDRFDISQMVGLKKTLRIEELTKHLADKRAPFVPNPPIVPEIKHG